MNKITLPLGAALVLLIGLLAGSPAFAAAPTKTMDAHGGKILTDMQGHALYTFSKDKPGNSECEGSCLKRWPALTAKMGDKAEGAYSIFTREDGGHQWAYNGMPLYRYAKDMKPGDMRGDGLGGSWHIARP